MDEAIEDGIGHGRLAEVVVPLLDRELSGDERGFAVVPVVEDFEQIAAQLVVHRHQAPVVENDEVGFGDRQVLQKPGQPEVACGVAVSIGLVGERTGEPGFADAGRAGDQEVEVVLEVVAGDELAHEALFYVVVLGSADVVVLKRPWRGGRFRQRLPVEVVLQDRLDALVARGTDGERARAGGLEPGGAVGLAEAQDAEAGTEALLGMAKGAQGPRIDPILTPTIRKISVQRQAAGMSS